MTMSQYSSNTHSMSTTPQPTEEINTIFVIGFPDDITEREFANIFTFCPGFEASVLKYPHEDDFVLSSATFGRLNMGEVESMKRKQIIGFAKFKSRTSALEAKEILNGRRIDVEQNCILKCELAKKNLHAKQNGVVGIDDLMYDCTVPMFSSQCQSSSDFDYNSSCPQFSSSLSYNSVGRIPTVMNNTSRTFSDFDSNFSSSTSFPRSQLHHPIQATYPHSPHTGMISTKSSPVISMSNDITRSCLSEILDDSRFDQHLLSTSLSSDCCGKSSMVDNKAPGAPLSMATSHPCFNTYSSSGLTINTAVALGNGCGIAGMVSPGASSSVSSNTVLGSNSGFESALYHNLDSFSLAQQQQVQNQQKLCKQQQLLNGQYHHHNHNHQIPLAQSAASNPHQQQAYPTGHHIPQHANAVKNNSNNNNHIHTQAHHHNNTAHQYQLQAMHKKVKPVLSDQNNPPCNTLYVGNLPLNTSEDELRQIFVQCNGYKRLCFRLKPNHGPMCFVEFETVEHATTAMNTLYGHPLSNSTKGGIRLSYSKNPLGVRSNPSTINNQLIQPPPPAALSTSAVTTSTSIMTSTTAPALS